MTEPSEIAAESRVSSRLKTSLQLGPLAFNVLHALVIVAAYRDATDLNLQIWLMASALTLFAQLIWLFASRRRRKSTGAIHGDGRLRIADFGGLLLALFVCATQAGFLAFALSTSAFGPQLDVGIASTSGNWGRLLWAEYALIATPLAYLQALLLTPYRAARLLERGALRFKNARWLLGSCVGLSVVTLLLSELVVYFL
ncbi:MAG TPA: hypothetical protein VER96_30925 [Polyangiaceae bacterium]|nr:hypothetical protein [Polyangiaceae bacterium]